MRLLEVCASLPRGRGYRFEPRPRAADDPRNPLDPLHDGVSADLVHRGERIARAAPDGATYCCGVTFEAFFRAYPEMLERMSADEVRALMAEWFCPTMGHAGAVEALVARGLADRITPSDARAGDLCQFWRSVDLHRPSGHSVIFLEWADAGRAMRYWSSQQATRGIGEHEEPVGEGWEIHVARLRLPRSGARGSTITASSTGC